MDQDKLFNPICITIDINNNISFMYRHLSYIDFEILLYIYEYF